MQIDQLAMAMHVIFTVHVKKGNPKNGRFLIIKATHHCNKHKVKLIGAPRIAIETFNLTLRYLRFNF